MTNRDLISKAQKFLAEVSFENAAFPVVYVLKSSKGNLYTAVGDNTADLVKTLAEAEDTVISSIVAMFESGVLEVPSQRFRRELVSLNPENKKTEVIFGIDRTKTFEAIGI